MKPRIHYGINDGEDPACGSPYGGGTGQELPPGWDWCLACVREITSRGGRLGVKEASDVCEGTDPRERPVLTGRQVAPKEPLKQSQPAKAADSSDSKGDVRWERHPHLLADQGSEAESAFPPRGTRVRHKVSRQTGTVVRSLVEVSIDQVGGTKFTYDARNIELEETDNKVTSCIGGRHRSDFTGLGWCVDCDADLAPLLRHEYDELNAESEPEPEPPKYRSSVYCEHANENPNQICRCKPDCACREYMCIPGGRQ